MKSDPSELLKDRIGVALISQLYEMCKTVELDDEDYTVNDHWRKLFKLASFSDILK